MNVLYNDARERMLKNQMNWSAMSFVMLAYTGDPVASFVPTHLIQSDVGTPYAVSQPMLMPSVRSGGYARTGAAEFLAIPIGSNVTFLVLCEDQPTPTPRRLLAFMSDLNNLPFAPNGGSYLVKPDWLNAQGWFRS